MEDLYKKFPFIKTNIEVKDGWKTLIDDCLTEIKDLMDGFSVGTIKEKFGGIRIYIEPDEDKYPNYFLGIDNNTYRHICSIVSKYEHMSYKICEVCGKEGKLQTKNNWLKTLCIDHNKDYKNVVGFLMDLSDQVNESVKP